MIVDFKLCRTNTAMPLNLHTVDNFTQVHIDLDFESPQNSIITLTLLQGWWGRCEKNYLLKEEGREGREKKRTQRARRARGSNPGPAAC